MINIFYGIRRLLLLNTASYSVGDFPLDKPLTISAPNNRGKSTAINALQFPFLSNMNDMSFPRSNEDTRKYYFPYDNSFVVSEIVTETGIYVVGAAGKGQASGYDYQLFAYQSRLDMDDFLVHDPATKDRQVRNYKELISKLGKGNVWVKSLSPKQMRDALMGKSITLPNDEKFTIGVFRLRSMTDENYRLFIRVFKNLLHMNNVNLEEMKRLLIDVLLPGEGSTTIDFMARYRILNEEVEKAKANVDTAIKIAPDVDKLAKASRARDQSFGILRTLFDPITTAYKTARGQREKEIQDIDNQILSIDPKMMELKDSQEPLQNSIEGFAIKQDKLKQKLDEIAAGETRFALYSSVEQLQLHIESMQIKVERLVGELQRTYPEDIKGLQNDLNNLKQQLKNHKARMSAIDNNLLFVLTKHFDESQIQIIVKLLNRDLLSALPLGEGGVAVLDEEQFVNHINEMLSRCKDGYYDDGCVRVKLKNLQTVNIEDYFNYEMIRDSLARLERRKSDLERDLVVALDYKGMEQKKNDLLGKIKKDERNLRDYRLFIEAKKGKAEHEAAFNDIGSFLDSAKAKLAGITDNLLKLGEQKQSLITDKKRKIIALELLKTKYAQVVPVQHHEPIGAEPIHKLPSQLEDMIDTYLLAQEEIDSNRKQIESSLSLIESKNGLRFTSGNDEETIIRELVEAIEGQEEYLKQQKNCQEAVSQEIGALLKGLTDRFDTFTYEIRRFNRLMNSRKISNINRIEFVVDGSNDILRAVEAIVHKDTIFSNPERVHHAVRQLDELISRKNVKLSLESLFNMGIEVELEGGKVSSSFNDANIQSTGTGLTVKVILNVMLLNRLLFIRDGQVVNIPIYIDEAGQIDPANQQTLIDQCLPAGFVPVFASVEAQATADYWIGLNEVGGRIYVDQNDWFRLSKLDEIVAEADNA
ncbi:MAG: hypothetical protein OEM02_13850 [Desulfobulbaceae bacterium]|nr:hypothetical protein [Desulfobulbaceae bacterium]